MLILCLFDGESARSGADEVNPSREFGESTEMSTGGTTSTEGVEGFVVGVCIPGDCDER